MKDRATSFCSNHKSTHQMQLTTKEILGLTNAHLALNGYPQVVEQQGRPKEVMIPYDLSPKARWNVAKNLSILRRLAEAHDEVVTAYRREMLQFGKKQDKSANLKTNEAEMNAEVERINNLIREVNTQVNEVSGLLKIPVEGLNLKASPIPPEAIAILMPLLDGEPKFDETPAAK